MEQRDLPSNSLNNPTQNKKTEEKLKPVVSGGVKVKKKSFGERIVDRFISKDIDNIPEYLINNVLVPLAKKTVLDTMSIILNGKTRSNDSFNEGTVSNFKPYHNAYNRGVRVLGPSAAPRRREYRTTFNDLRYDDYEDALDVRDNMLDILNNYGYVLVSHFYELSGRDDLIEYTDNHYGWTNETFKQVKLERDGLGGIIKLPPASLIDIG